MLLSGAKEADAEGNAFGFSCVNTPAPSHEFFLGNCFERPEGLFIALPREAIPLSFSLMQKVAGETFRGGNFREL